VNASSGNSGSAPNPMASDAPGPFRILHVCIGNQCRSVIAERLTRRGMHVRLGDGAASFRVASAGTRAIEGGPMDPHTAEALRALGAETDGFAARRLSVPLLRDADLILAATRDERDGVVAMLPQALRRAFTLKEFARLAAPLCQRADGAAPDVMQHARRVVAQALTLRGRVPYVDPAMDDIPDPARTAPGLEACAYAVATALEGVLDALLRHPSATPVAE